MVDICTYITKTSMWDIFKGITVFVTRIQSGCIQRR